MKSEFLLKKAKTKIMPLAFAGILSATALFPNILKAQEPNYPKMGIGIAGRNFKENVFTRPDTSTTLFYGSGDVNKDDVIDSLDYYAILNGVKNDESDVNGDGKTDSTDARILKDHLTNGTILPSDWNNSTKEQRIDWVKKMIKIDQSDKRGGSSDSWISLNFGVQTFMNFYGIPDSLINIANKPFFNYDTTKNGRFNLPMYLIGVYKIPYNKYQTHGMNAIMVGDNVLEFKNWYFFEPQYDSTRVIGNSSDLLKNIPKNSLVSWYLPYQIDVKNNIVNMVNFMNDVVDSAGDVSVYWHGKGIVLNRIVDSVKETPKNDLENYVLGQNYPNPFNPRTTIEYELKRPSNVQLEVYNVLGQKVKTLINGYERAGDYKINFNGSGLPSGVYLYNLRAGKFNKVKKMLLVK